MLNYTTTPITNATIRIALTNLTAYTEGVLLFKWLELPATEEEINEAYNSIKRSDRDEEFFITDYETELDGFEIGEYDSIEKLNELAEQLAGLDENELLIFQAYAEYYGYDEAFEKLLTGELDGNIYYDCDTMEDVAYQVIEECGVLDQIPDNLQCYFDYDAYARDLAIKNTFVKISGHFVQIYN